MVTEEDKETGDRFVKLQIEYDTNLDWWNKEAYPALDAALTALNLQDSPPDVESYNVDLFDETHTVLGKYVDGYSAFSVTREQMGKHMEWDSKTVKLFNLAKSRRSLSIKSFHLPSKYAESFLDLCNSMKKLEQVLFTVEFSGADSKVLGTCQISNKYSFVLNTLVYLRSISYPERANCIIVPFFTSTTTQDDRGDDMKFLNKPFSVPYRLTVPDNVLLETKSLKLIPGEFGVIKKSLRENIAESPVVAHPAQGMPERQESTSPSEVPNGDVAKAMVDERYPETRLRQIEPAYTKKLSTGELRYAINEMYARHGAVFPQKEISAVFQTKKWYRPRPDLSFDQIEEREFSEIERVNLKTLGEARNLKSSGQSAVAPGAGDGTPAQIGQWLIPDSSQRRLTRADLSGLNADQLWRARNEIYARNGLIFSTARGRTFAASLGANYHGTVNSQDKVIASMNVIERANVELIKSLER